MWIQTYSGLAFFYDNPTVEMIDLQDIAHALANCCRYNGHVKSFFSVAQHSVACSYQSPERSIRRWCLMHDAAEAYIGDMVRPLKDLPDMKPFRDYEVRIEKLIEEKFKLGWPMPTAVREIDFRMLATEAQQLFRTKPPMPWNIPDPYPDFVIKPQPPELSEVRFLERYHELYD